MSGDASHATEVIEKEGYNLYSDGDDVEVRIMSGKKVLNVQECQPVMTSFDDRGDIDANKKMSSKTKPCKYPCNLNFGVTRKRKLKNCSNLEILWEGEERGSRGPRG